MVTSRAVSHAHLRYHVWYHSIELYDERPRLHGAVHSNVTPFKVIMLALPYSSIKLRYNDVRNTMLETQTNILTLCISTT